MKATHTALASLSLLLLTAPSANSDVVSNDRTAAIAFFLGDSASLCEAVGDVDRCRNLFELPGIMIEDAIDRNTELIQNENTRIDSLESKTSDLEKTIGNVGALSAALGSIPAVSADSQFTCGFGGGTYSSAYALSAGCASRVSDRVSVNAALATLVTDHLGDTDDNISARAGFTFRLGKIDDSPKVAARKAAALHDEVAALRDENALIRDENALIKAASIEQKQLNFALMARLERLEAIALGQSPAITKVSLK